MKMIFMLTVWSPPNTAKEVLNKLAKATEKGFPKSIKKWLIYTTADGLNGSKGYELIFTEKGQADEALIAIHKILAPFADIEGYRYKIEPLLGMKDTAKIL